MKNIFKTILLLLVLLAPALSFAEITIHDVHTYRMVPSRITDTSAVLVGNATITGDNPPEWGFAYFRYSALDIPPVFCNDLYGSAMVGTKDIPIFGVNQYFYTTITDLTPDTTYYFCAVASNKASNPKDVKIEYGEVSSFTTLACPPAQATSDCTTITTEEAVVLGDTRAYLKGKYNSIRPVKTYFQYRKQVIGTPLPWIVVDERNRSGGGSADVSFLLSGLEPETTYNFQFVGEANLGTSAVPDIRTYWGRIETFETNAPSGVGTGGGQPGPLVQQGNNGWQYGLPPNCIVLGTCPQLPTPQCVLLGTCPTQLPNPNVQCLGPLCPQPAVTPGVQCIGPLCPQPLTPSFGTPFTGSGTLGGGIFGSGGSGSVAPAPNVGNLATPYLGAVVGYHEGVEHVFVRQIMNNIGFAKYYGYKDGENLQRFAETYAHIFAQIFGYVGNDLKEVRVVPPDVAAYEFGMKDGMLAIYEYFAGRLININVVDERIKPITGYEYYYQR